MGLACQLDRQSQSPLEFIPPEGEVKILTDRTLYYTSETLECRFVNESMENVILPLLGGALIIPYYQKWIDGQWQEPEILNEDLLMIMLPSFEKEIATGDSYPFQTLVDLFPSTGKYRLAVLYSDEVNPIKWAYSYAFVVYKGN